MGYSTAYDSKEGMGVEDKFIMFVVDPVETLKKQYQTMFAKIFTPPSKILM